MAPTMSQRFLAWLVDQLVITVIGVVLGLCGFVAFGSLMATGSDALSILGAMGMFVLVGVLFVINFLYYGYTWSRDGQSPGKTMMGLQVTNRDGELLSFLGAGLRGTVGYWISSFVFYLGYIWAFFDADQEAWHDKLFNTRVTVAGSLRPGGGSSGDITPVAYAPPMESAPPAPYTPQPSVPDQPAESSWPPAPAPESSWPPAPAPAEPSWPPAPEPQAPSDQPGAPAEPDDRPPGSSA